MILPYKIFEGLSNGENFVYNKFKKILPEGIISFHNYSVKFRQVDIILLVPRRGILIIEIKGFKSENIIGVPDNSIIYLKNSPSVPSPLNQVNNYRYIITNLLKENGIDSVYVLPSICYPFIDKDQFINKGLNEIAAMELCILNEDFENSDTLMSKIYSIFDLGYNQIAQRGLIKFGFDDELLVKTGKLISPNFEIVKDSTNKYDIIQEILLREEYSILKYINGNDSFTNDDIEGLISKWQSGTKIYFYSNSEDYISRIGIMLNDRIKRLHLQSIEDFRDKIFLFDVCKTDYMGASFTILNGENHSLYEEQLRTLHNTSSFNHGQYDIEHAELDDIIVKAGAGTGKTYSIISRINYLIWKEKYEPVDLKRAIVMITFTNEAADSMKDKIRKNFFNHYYLTKDTKYLSYIENLEDINISTIDSISRRLIKEFSSNLGLGKDFKIITGEYKKKQFISSNLDPLIKNYGEITSELDMSMYYLIERLSMFLKKLDDKNIDILNDELNLGSDKLKDFSPFIEVLKQSQKDINEYCFNNNTVYLGDLIRKLKQLEKYLIQGKDSVSTKFDYLFIDEFQDTDDVQIELMKSLQIVFNYKFFAVGDVKQCIYRFRGAQDRAFDTLSRNWKSIRTINLNKNYRTETLLLEKLNEIFNKWNDNDIIEYAESDNLKGTKKNSNDFAFNIDRYNNLVDILKQYKNKLDEEDILDLNKKEKNKEKIAILVRYNYQVAEIKEICEENNIYVETDIGGELFKIDPTIDFYKLVLALKYNKDPKYLYNLYTTSFVKDEIPKNELFECSREQIVEYFYSNLPSGLNNWNNYLEMLKEKPILNVLSKIMKDLQPWTTFSMKIKATNTKDKDRMESYYLKNIDILFEKLINISNTDYLTINKLSDYLEIMILTKREEESRVSYNLDNSEARIICTTVHKSKGLEFDTVILPFTEFDISSSRAKGDVDLIYVGDEVGYNIKGRTNNYVFRNDLYDNYKKNESIDRRNEESRILYVALTRAKRNIIYLSGSNTRGVVPKYSWRKLIGGGKQ